MEVDVDPTSVIEKYPPDTLLQKAFFAEIPYNSINWEEMAVPKEILDPVERFDRNRDSCQP